VRTAKGIALGMASMVCLVGLAAGHPHEYVGGSDTNLTHGCPNAGEPGHGYVCFRAGELPGGDLAFSIVDDVQPIVSGVFCQDFNADSVCGDDGSVGGVVEPQQRFCIEGTVASGDWDPFYDAYVLLDGPVSGRPASSACATWAFGTHGFVVHWPDCSPSCPPPTSSPLPTVTTPPSPVVQVDPPGATILSVPSGGSGAQVACFGVVQLNLTNGASLPVAGIRSGSAPCWPKTGGTPPCDLYTGKPGVASCWVNPAACCTTVFEFSTGTAIACVKSTFMRIDVQNDGFWDVVLPAAVVTGPPC